MRKLTLLISMLFLSLGMAWAQEIPLTDGAIVTITNVQENGTEYALHINNGTLSVGGADVAATTLGNAAKFKAIQKTNGKWAFYNESTGLYMIWRGNSRNPGQNDNKGTLGEYDPTYCDLNVVDGSTVSPGLVALSGQRAGATRKGEIVLLRDGSFDSWDGVPAWAGNYSNLFRIDVLEEDVTATLTDSESGVVFGGTYRGLRGQTKPTLPWNNVVVSEGWEGNEYKATITLPLLVNEKKMIAIHEPAAVHKWYVNAENSNVRVDKEPFDFSNIDAWVWKLHPVMTGKVVTLTIEHVATGKFVKVNTTSDKQHDAENTVIIADANEATTFEMVECSNHSGITSLKVFGRGAYLSINSDRDENVNLGVWNSSHLGTRIHLTDLPDPVAKIGDTNYYTFVSALEAATAGQTITLVADVTKDVTVSKKVTIDGAGKTYTGKMTLKADATIKNVNFDGKGYNGYAVETRGANYVTIEGCTAKNYGYGFVQLASGTVLTTVKDVTVSDMNYGVKVDYSNAVVLENVDITAGVAAVLNSNYGEKTITIKNSKLNIYGTWTKNNTTKTNVVFEGANTVGEFKADAAIDNFKLVKEATLAAAEGLDVTTEDGYKVVFENGVYTSVVKPNDVAKIGEQGYESLEAALAAAQAGQTITLVADINENVTLAKNVTIDGAGKNYTGTMTVNNVTATIENVAFVKGQVYKHKSTGSAAKITIKNCTFDGEGMDAYAVNLGGTNKIVLENVTAKDYGYGLLQVPSSCASLEIKNVEVSGCYYGFKVDYANAVSLENVKVADDVTTGIYDSNFGNKTYTIKNSVITSIKTWERAGYSGVATFKFEGVNVLATPSASQYAKYALAAGATLTAPADMEITTDVADHEVAYENGTYSVVEKKNYVAQIGEQSYESLADAIAAAEAGNTITFLADITEDVTVSKDVTIDGAGKTFTGKMSLTSNKGAVTIKNVNFDGKGYNGYAVETRGVYYLTVESCTAKNYGYGFIQLASSTVLTSVKNVTVSDMNYGVKVDYATEVVLENVDVTAGVAAVLNSNYGEKTITIKNSKLNILGTWKRNDTTKTTYVFEGENTVGEFKTEAALDNFKLEKEATLAAAEGLTVTTDAAGYMVKYVDGKYKVVAENVKNEATGDTYATIAEALAAANAGDTITLLADITEDVTVSKKVTIDGAGKTYTGKMTLKADATIKNLNFDGNGYNGYAVETRGANYLTIEDCTAKNYGYGFVQLASGTALTTVKNVTVSDMNYGVKVDYSNAVVLENVDITAGVAAVLNSNYGEKTITIKNSKLNIYGTWTRNSTIKTNIVFDGANTVGEFKADAAVDNFKLAAGATLTAPNTVTVTTDVAGYMVKYENGVYKVVGANVKNEATGVTYATIADAIKDATAGQTITFLEDITENDVTVSKKVTIDGAGKTYTGKMTLKADATIKNLNFDGNGYNGYAVETRGAQYLTIEGCTAKNYGYGFVQLASGTALTTVKDVTVSDMNYGVKVDYSNAVVLENVDITAGVAAVLNSNYGEKTITIKNSKLNILGTWKRNDTTKTTYVFEGENTVAQFKTESALDNFKLAEGATLAAPEGLNVAAVKEGCVVVYADGKYKAFNPVVMVGENAYPSIQAAIDAVPEGEAATIKVAKDHNITGYTVLNGNYPMSVVVSGGKKITLDLNGKTVTYEEKLDFTLSSVFYVYGSGSEFSFVDSSEKGTGVLDVKSHREVVNRVFWSGTYGVMKFYSGTYYLRPADENGNFGWMFYNNIGDSYFYGGTYIMSPNGFDMLGCQGSGVRPDHKHNIIAGTFNRDVAKITSNVNIAEGSAQRKNADGMYEVFEIVAKVGDAPYKTLAEAVEAANDGDEVTLVKDATDTGIVINKSLTIDFNENTYSFNEGVGSTGTPSNGFQILKGNTVTLKNGTLNVADEAANKFYILVQNYADKLTVEDMTLDGTNLDKWSLTDGDSYVLSNNSGNVVVEGETNIIANNDGALAFAFDACDKTSWGYTLPVVKVYTTGEIVGKIESSATIKLYAGTYSFDVIDFCAPRHATVDNHNDTWTVEALDVESVEIVYEDYYRYCSYEVQNVKNVETFTYKRDLAYFGEDENMWVALYLPVEIPVAALGDNYEVAYLNNVLSYDKDENGEIDEMAMEYIIIKSGTLHANTPYMIRVKDGSDIEFTLENVQLQPTANRTVLSMGSAYVDFTVGGVYEATLGDKLLEKLFSSRFAGNVSPAIYQPYMNEWGNNEGVHSGIFFQPFNVYMTLCMKPGSPYIISDNMNTIGSRVVGEENDGVTTIYDVPVDMNVEGMIFDLSGRRVNETEKGIYIKDGKKVLVK